MASVGRQERDAAADLISTLETTAPRSSFFQIVRLFNRIAKAKGRAGSSGVGALRPKEDPVRFRAATGMRHPAVEIVKVKRREDDGKPELTVSFLGLTGPTGVMPDHYTEFLVQQAQARNSAAADFFDLFNHRIISLFYRAWAKYRLPVRFEEPAKVLEDPFSKLLASLAGLGLDAARPTLHQEDGDLLAVAGVLARRVRTADGVRRIIAGLFDLPVEIVEFQGRWIVIPEDERTRLGTEPSVKRFAVLGQTAVVGRQVWDVQSRFEVRLGPLDFTTFQSLLEASAVARSLREVIRLAVGPSLDFDVRLILKGAEVPILKLDGVARPPRLGQTSWLVSRPGEQDRDDATIGRRFFGQSA